MRCLTHGEGGASSTGRLLLHVKKASGQASAAPVPAYDQSRRGCDRASLGQPIGKIGFDLLHFSQISVDTQRCPRNNVAFMKRDPMLTHGVASICPSTVCAKCLRHSALAEPYRRAQPKQCVPLLGGASDNLKFMRRAAHASTVRYHNVASDEQSIAVLGGGENDALVRDSCKRRALIGAIAPNSTALTERVRFDRALLMRTVPLSRYQRQRHPSLVRKGDSMNSNNTAGSPTPAWRTFSDAMILAGANILVGLANWRAVRRFYHAHRRIPQPAVPDTYAERMLWRKIVDHNPRFVELSDKLACKEYVKRLCPDLAVPETLWIGKDADDIPDESLRGNVFVKTNHAFKQNYTIRDGVVDRAHLKSTTDVWLVSVHGRGSFQWSYSQVKPRLFIERSIGDAAGDLLEFNIRASDGRPLLSSVIGHNKLANQWSVYLDLDGRPTYGPGSKPDSPPAPLPQGLDIERPYRDALAYTAKLSRGIDYARYDFMWNGETLYAGEITIYPSSGIMEIRHPGARRLLTEGWRLEVADFLTRPQTGFRRLYAHALRRRLQQRTRRHGPELHPAPLTDSQVDGSVTLRKIRRPRAS